MCVMSVQTWDEPQAIQLARGNEHFARIGSLIQSAGPTGSGIVVALIPAHNEESQIGAAIRSLQEQDLPPDIIVVSADNCTDGTAREADAAGACVFETA